MDITADVSDALISRIEGIGGKIIFPSWQYHTIRAEVNLSMVETVAGYSEVKFIQPAVKSKTVGSGFIGANSGDKTITNRPMIFDREPIVTKFKPFPGSFADRAARVRNQLENYFENATASITNRIPFTGTVNSEGDRAHRADDARNTYGYAGQGIKIGVLSDSYNSLGGAAADITSGKSFRE